ncbi:DNA primase [Anaerofustis stercorihominis]|uniref:DNA primase n=1 Tax=Anaerofustis stercorihominis TaxID=214853 RepID=A0A3E3DZY7_9FIRM|nr:DNA primase [Anaerofustis stercorihominis]RGD74489.1 DNA primase [Anaerofustis stercorihominis]
MKGYFKKDFIRRLVDDADIVGIINQYVPLQRSGTRYKARCPFHTEKTPSFVVTPEMGRYHCFGCNANGDVLDFLMEMNKLDFSGAVELLADMEGVNVQYEENGNYTRRSENTISYNEKQELYNCIKDSANYYYKNLMKSGVPLKYLLDRGLKKETIKKFGLGYSINEFDNLYNYLVKEKKYSVNTLIKAGLVRTNDKGGVYDYFRDRIMFPIQDVNGKLIAFGGRIFKDVKNAPKYLNSPETLVFKKNSTLYNLNNARKELSEKPLILVEGYMDVISLVNNGINNAVATLGTAFNINHAKLINRYTKNVVIMYDSDNAGLNATIKAGEILESANIYPKVVRLPKGDDPDSYILNNSIEKFNNLVENGVDSIEFRIKLLEDNHNLLDNWEKVDFIKKACVIIGKVDDDVRKEFYIKYLHERTKAEISTIEKEVNTNSFITPNHLEDGKKDDKEQNIRKNQIKQKIISAQEMILKYMIDNALDIDKIKEVNLDEDILVGDDYKKIYEKIVSCINLGKKVDFIELFDYNDTLATTMSRIVSLDQNIDSDDLNQAKKTLMVNNINKKITKVKLAIRDIQESEDKEMLDVLIAEFYKLKSELLKAKNGGTLI